jgi:hypothetical protein
LSGVNGANEFGFLVEVWISIFAQEPDKQAIATNSFLERRSRKRRRAVGDCESTSDDQRFAVRLP